MLEQLARTVSRVVRKSRTFRVAFQRLGFNPSFMATDYYDFAKEGYMENPYVYAAVTQTANSAAGVPPILYRVTGETNREGRSRVLKALDGYERKGHVERIERNKLRWAANKLIQREATHYKRQLDLPYAICRKLALKALVQEGELEEVDAHESLALLDRPNPYYQRSFQAFMQAIISYLEIGGEAFIEPIKGGSGMPRELYVLSPNGVDFPKPKDENKPIEMIEFERDGGDVDYRYDPDPTETELFFMKYFHPLSPLRGMSPLMAAAKTVDVNNAARTWNFGQLQNGAMMSGFLMNNGTMGEDQRDEIQAQFRQQHQGPENAGGIFLVEGSTEGLDFKQAQQTARDMQWGDLTRVTALETSIVYNIPPEILGDSRTKTYSNYQEARRAFYLEKIVPLLDFVYGEINSTVMALYHDPLLMDYDLERVDALQEDMNRLYERVIAGVKGSVLRINEAREILGLDPIDGGDVILTPATQVPLEASLQADVDEQDEAARRAIEIDQKRGGDGHLSNLPELFPSKDEVSQ